MTDELVVLLCLRLALTHHFSTSIFTIPDPKVASSTKSGPGHAAIFSLRKKLKLRK